MPQQPTYPGVYIEEIPSGAKPIEGVGTSTAAFIGFTTKGPLDEPEVTTGFDQYEDIYGGIRDLGSSCGYRRAADSRRDGWPGPHVRCPVRGHRHSRREFQQCPEAGW